MYSNNSVLTRSGSRLPSGLDFERPEPHPLHLGIVVCDPDIGATETFGRLVGALGGKEKRGGTLGKAFAIDFNPFVNSAVQFSPHLDNVDWVKTFRDICKLRLIPRCSCSEWCDCEHGACDWCASVMDYAAVDRHGLTTAVFCSRCGHATGFDWMHRSANIWWGQRQSHVVYAEAASR